MKGAWSPLAACLVLASAFSGCTAPETPDHLIEMEGKRFSPATLTIQAGESVQWMNRDPIQHDVRAADGRWASPMLHMGEAYTSTFDEPGTYKIYCRPHAHRDDAGDWAGMVHTVVVQ